MPNNSFVPTRVSGALCFKFIVRAAQFNR
jgi:hypothetical protein